MVLGVVASAVVFPAPPGFRLFKARISVAELTDCHDLRVNGGSADTVLVRKRGISPSR